MKILYLITGLGGGGAEKVVADLADQMLLLGHQVKIAYLKGDIVVRPDSCEIELIYLGLEGIKNAKFAYRQYKKLITDFRPDVVHAHMVHANIFARISRKFCPVSKLICTAHSNNEGGKVRMLMYRMTHTLADLTTNVSLSASLNFEQLGAVPEGGIITVYNGIDLEKFKFNSRGRELIRSELGLQANTKMLLAVGRFHEAKNYPLLIHAFKKIIINFEKNTPKLVIVGDGELRREIENLITILNINEHVIVLGRRDDIVALMSAADVFVLSSHFEGFGLVVAEAMAIERFVVATDCGGIKEVMGGTGLLVSPINEQELIKQLLYAIFVEDTEYKKNTDQALLHIKQNFSLSQIIQQWLDIYASK